MSIFNIRDLIKKQTSRILIAEKMHETTKKKLEIILPIIATIDTKTAERQAKQYTSRIAALTRLVDCGLVKHEVFSGLMMIAKSEKAPVRAVEAAALWFYRNEAGHMDMWIKNKGQPLSWWWSMVVENKDIA